MVQKRQGKCLHRTVEPDADGMELGRYLKQKLGFTGSQIRSMKFRENGIQRNGERCRVNAVLKAGDELELLLEAGSPSSAHLAEAEEEVAVLYEDEDLIAVWKEAGVVVHPAHGHYSDTLSNRLHTYFQGKGEQVTIRSIGRLDKDTCGILVFAKNQVAAARLWNQKENGIFRKEYLAVCEGTVGAEDGWQTIDLPIGKMAGEKMKMCVSDSGLKAVTHFQVLWRTETRTGIRVRIDTGRTHQIRVHMAFTGHPLVGDPLYGSSEAAHGLCLCAWQAELLQPFSMGPIRIRAEEKQVPSWAGKFKAFGLDNPLDPF